MLKSRSTIALPFGIPPLLPRCAAIDIGYGGDSAYNAAFRIKTEDAALLTPDEQVRPNQTKSKSSNRWMVRTLFPNGKSLLVVPAKVALLVFKWTWRPVLNELNGLTPEAAALTQLRLKALKKGANAVAAPVCKQSVGIDWGNNCFESWVCAGQAVLVP